MFTHKFQRSGERSVRPLARYAIVLFFVIGAGAFLMAPPVARLDGPRVYAIKDAQIVTGPGKTIPKGTVVFRDGLIIAVGETAKIPADARVIDGTGLTVYPGLIDAFGTFGQPAPPAPPAPAGFGNRAAAAARAQTPQTPEQVHGDPSASAADEFKPDETGLEAARFDGFTTELISPPQGIFAGQTSLVDLGSQDVPKMVVRAPVALTIQFTTARGFGGGIYPVSLMGSVAYIRQTFYDAIHYRDEVARMDRAKHGVERPEYDKKLAALLPVLKGEMPVIFVADTDTDIHRALAISDEFKLKPIIQGAMEGYRVAEMLGTRKIPVIVSLDFPKRQADLPDDVDEPLRILRERADAPKCAGKLSAAGVKLAFSSGKLKPDDFIANVRKAVDNGLSKDAAFRALTIDAAEILGASDQLGTIEKGKIANLTVVSGDLFAKDSKVRHVFIDGDEVELKKPETPARRPEGMGTRPGDSGNSGDDTDGRQL
ncbi:MAG TPA: amidohydrolase family protein [Blastocatellia bacterium]